MAESLQGYGGIFPLQDGYLKAAFDMVRAHGGVTIADEVQTGFNRCGETFWGFQMSHNNVVPDIVTIAKGMGNGVGIIGGSGWEMEVYGNKKGKVVEEERERAREGGKWVCRILLLLITCHSSCS